MTKMKQYTPPLHSKPPLTYICKSFFDLKKTFLLIYCLRDWKIKTVNCCHVQYKPILSKCIYSSLAFAVNSIKMTKTNATSQVLVCSQAVCRHTTDRCEIVHKFRSHSHKYQESAGQISLQQTDSKIWKIEKLVIYWYSTVQSRSSPLALATMMRPWSFVWETNCTILYISFLTITSLDIIAHVNHQQQTSACCQSHTQHQILRCHCPRVRRTDKLCNTPCYIKYISWMYVSRSSDIIIDIVIQ